MGNFQTELREAAKEVFCGFAKAEDAGTRWFNELSPVNLPNVGRFWRSAVCDDPGDIPIPVPFEGGQCDGIAYTVVIQFDSRFVQGEQTTTPNVIGPISGVTTVTNPNGTRQPVIQANPNKNAGSPSSDSLSYQDPFIVSVTREDGQPDDCGDPPADIPPFSPAPRPISFTYQDVNNTTVNVSGDMTIFAPVVIAPVTVIAPVRVELPDFNFDGYLSFDPTFEFNFGRQGAEKSPGDGDPNNGPDDPIDNPITPEDDSDRRLIGMKVIATPDGTNRNTIIPQSGGPTLYLPRIANAYFRVRNRGGLSWFGPITVRNRAEFVPVPENVNAVFGVVDFDGGWSGTTIQVHEGFEES